jgi:hypothetical protein
MERVLDPLSRTTRDLDEAKHILEGIEATALSGVALALTEAAENLSEQQRTWLVCKGPSG